MAAMNIDNIMSGLGKVASITSDIDNTAKFDSIPIEYLYVADNNPYKIHDTEESIEELADSIKANGLLHPIVVNKIDDNHYKIISGERRFTAIKDYLKWKLVPCRVYDNLSDDEAQLRLHCANLQAREYSTAEKLNFYEDMRKRLENLKKEKKYSGGIQSGLAKMLNVSERQIQKYKIIVDKASLEERKAIAEGKININNAVDIIQSNLKKSEAKQYIDESGAKIYVTQNNSKFIVVAEKDNKKETLSNIAPSSSFDESQYYLDNIATVKGYKEFPKSELSSDFIADDIKIDEHKKNKKQYEDIPAPILDSKSFTDDEITEIFIVYLNTFSMEDWSYFIFCQPDAKDLSKKYFYYPQTVRQENIYISFFPKSITLFDKKENKSGSANYKNLQDTIRYMIRNNLVNNEILINVLKNKLDEVAL